MADENILTWDVTNWITVVLMAAIGFFVIAAAQKYWQKKQTQGV
jgi:predicted negative regulator of RcsB-dependent stress response